MKNNKLLVVSTSVILIILSCSKNQINEPEQIGKSVFKILNNISIKGKQEYINCFLSVEEIRELGKNESVVEDAELRKELGSLLKEEWIDRISNDYNEIKVKGVKSGINWTEIEYLDFIYELKDIDGIKGSEGELYFKHNDNIFKVEATAIWDGKEFKLVEIKNLYEE